MWLSNCKHINVCLCCSTAALSLSCSGSPLSARRPAARPAPPDPVKGSVGIKASYRLSRWTARRSNAAELILTLAVTRPNTNRGADLPVPQVLQSLLTFSSHRNAHLVVSAAGFFINRREAGLNTSSLCRWESDPESQLQPTQVIKEIINHLMWGWQVPAVETQCSSAWREGAGLTDHQQQGGNVIHCQWFINVVGTNGNARPYQTQQKPFK